MALSYLTIQDILWINLQLTGKVQHYQYARLEEATFYQYGYRGSSNLLAQSARFAGGFSKLHPFEAGNDATGFVALVSFLKHNGRKLKVTDGDALAWFESLRGREADGTSILESTTAEEHDHHDSVREVTRWVIDSFPKTIEALSALVSTA